LAHNTLTAPPSETQSAVVEDGRPLSAPVATDLATVRGPLQLALRDAGLPETPESLMVLETIALKAKLGLPGEAVSLKAFRRAARLYRKLATNPRRVPTVPEMSRTAAKKAIQRAMGIPTGRQWKKWKKLQRRAQQGGV